MQQPRFGGARLVGAAAIALMSGCALTLALFGTDETGIRALVRFTARTSALLFSLAFAASAINRLWRGPVGRWLLRNRRYLGLSFAVSHGLHLAGLVALARVLDDPWLLRESGLVGVLGGGFGYLMIAALSATSWDGAVRWLGGRRWKRLHTFGMYVLGGIFLFSYGGRALATGAAHVLALTALVLAPFALRLAAALQPRPLSGSAGAGG
jgi:DMSO/TMAO reductase YedYZ heme-binding membrane subunit